MPLSTLVDKNDPERTKRPRSSSEETRARVVAAARIAFCQAGFDHVGVRDIAARAGTDAALVIRLFGSKEALFEQVAKGAFTLEAAFLAPPERLGQAVADFLLGPADTSSDREDFDAFRFLLRSAASPVAAPIVSANLHASLIAPLADRLGGKDAAARAALMTACVLGFATMRFALSSPTLQADFDEALRRPLAAALQACIT